MGGGNVREQTSGQVRLQFLELITKDAKKREIIVDVILAENMLDGQSGFEHG
jgi:hypothetical protein